MSKIKASDLIALFERMYYEGWRYVLGAAREGCVDCSGAFVYAYKDLGAGSIDHGSNSIFRKHVGVSIGDQFNTDPHPGYAAFKVRSSGSEPAKYRGDGVGDVYHIGLVDSTGRYVLNASSPERGFCRDSVKGYQFFVPLKAVDYSSSSAENEKSMKSIIGTAICTGDKVNVRSQPSTAGKIITKLNTGDEIKVADNTSANWWECQLNGQTCYVSAQYLTMGDDNEKAQDEPESIETTTLINAFGESISLLGTWRIAED